MTMNLQDLALVSKGSLYGDSLDVSEFSIDTRTLKRGEVYIAIEGKNFDGHNFIDDAEKKGAKAFVVSKFISKFFLSILIIFRVVIPIEPVEPRIAIFFFIFVIIF